MFTRNNFQKYSTQNCFSFKKNSAGFTLIELLVVIAIIGLLSSVVLASVSSARIKARDAKRISEIIEVNKAMEFYFDKYGHYPDSTSIPPVPDKPQLYKLGTGSEIDQILENEGFMRKVPSDPTNDNTHYYYYDPVHSCESVAGGWPAVLVIYNLEGDKFNNCNEVCGNTWTGDYCIIYP